MQMDSGWMFVSCPDTDTIFCPIRSTPGQILEIRDWCDEHRPMLNGSGTFHGDGPEDSTEDTVTSEEMLEGVNLLTLAYICPIRECSRIYAHDFRVIYHLNPASTDIPPPIDQIKVLKAKHCELHRSTESDEETEQIGEPEHGGGRPQIIEICPGIDDEGCPNGDMPRWALRGGNWTTYITESDQVEIIKGWRCGRHRSTESDEDTESDPELGDQTGEA